MSDKDSDDEPLFDDNDAEEEPDEEDDERPELTQDQLKARPAARKTRGLGCPHVVTSWLTPPRASTVPVHDLAVLPRLHLCRREGGVDP